MSISKLISARVISVGMDDALWLVQDLMNQAKIHHLPVVSGKKLVGVISDRDLRSALSPFIGTAGEYQRDKSTLEKRAHQIMSRDLITIPPETGVVAAAELILANDISALPVVNEHSELVGIVTWRDILRYAIDRGHQGTQ